MLNFPAALASAHPHRLAWEIARALAQVYHTLTGEHWRMARKYFEEPLDR